MRVKVRTRTLNNGTKFTEKRQVFLTFGVISCALEKVNSCIVAEQSLIDDWRNDDT